MGKLPRKMFFDKIQGYVLIHEKIYTQYHPEEGKQWHEVILILPAEDEEDKTTLIALCDIFIQGFRSGMIRREEGSLPQFDGDAPSAQKKALQVLLQHTLYNHNDLFALQVVGPLAKKYSLAKPKYISKAEIQAMTTKLGMKSI